MNSYAVVHQTTLETEECCNCGIVFAMPASMRHRLLNDGGSFYCPHGHQQHYTETEVQRLRKKLDAQTRVATEMAERAGKAEREAQAAKKARKRLMTRAKAGVCPCCNRTFVNLQRHMATKHKDAK